MQQHPGGCLVDVLRCGDEHDPALLECEVDAHVVGAVAGEPVDLMDDAVGDAVLLDVLDHPHQLGPVGRLGRGSRVDELLAEVGATGIAERRVGQLSGGQQQLIRQAQALAGQLDGSDKALSLALAYGASQTTFDLAWWAPSRTWTRPR